MWKNKKKRRDTRRTIYTTRARERKLQRQIVSVSMDVLMTISNE